jgi:biotin operon repressor
MADRVHEVMPEVLAALERWRGSSHVLSREELCGMVGCSDRVLRAAIVELRKTGHLIIADEGGGYRFARNAKDVYGYTMSLKARIQAMRTVIEKLEAVAMQEFGPPQLELFG